MQKILGPFLAALFAVGLALAVAGPARPGLRPAGSVLRGQWQASAQQGFESGLPGQEAALAAWTAVRYLLLREGEPGVVVGTGGWLYTDEEFVPVDGSGRLLAAAVDRIAAARDILAARDITLVVALVPTKASVYPQHLRRTLSPGLRARYGRVRDALAARGVLAPDLFAPLAAASRGVDVFLRTDTHWTAEGAAVAAEALASTIRPVLDRHGSARGRYGRTFEAPRERRGDLLAFLPLGKLSGIGPRPDTVRPVTTSLLDQPDDGSGLFGTLEIPVALVGTSYSAAGDWDFDGALRAALGADVLKVAEQGHGPFVPLQRYLESPAIDDPRPRVVVWEIPERYLCVPTPLGVAAASAAAQDAP